MLIRVHSCIVFLCVTKVVPCLVVSQERPTSFGWIVLKIVQNRATCPVLEIAVPWKLVTFRYLAM